MTNEFGINHPCDKFYISETIATKQFVQQRKNSCYPTSIQQIFDTDPNKMVVCIDLDKKLWVDFMGKKSETKNTSAGKADVFF